VNIRIFPPIMLGLICSAVHAQSSVTLYGQVNTGITYTSNVGGNASVAAQSGAYGGSRWGIRGAGAAR
jgi:GBP family porin